MFAALISFNSADYAFFAAALVFALIFTVIFAPVTQWLSRWDRKKKNDKG